MFILFFFFSFILLLLVRCGKYKVIKKIGMYKQLFNCMLWYVVFVSITSLSCRSFRPLN